MSSKMLNLIDKQMKVRNTIAGIAFVSKGKMKKKYVKILEDIIDSYYFNEINADFFITGKKDDEYYYEQMFIEMKRKNIISAIVLLDKYKELDKRYICIVESIINDANEKGYTM